MAAPRSQALQSFRSVYNPDSSGISPPPSVNINIIARYDNQRHQHIVLWNDIIRVFRNAFLMPLRIAYHQGIQLDVVMEIPAAPAARINYPTSTATSPALSQRSIRHSPSTPPSPVHIPNTDNTTSGDSTLLVPKMGSVRIARAPEERIPESIIASSMMTTSSAVYYPPPPSSIVAASVSVSTDVFPIPAVKTAHVRSISEQQQTMANKTILPTGILQQYTIEGFKDPSAGRIQQEAVRLNTVQTAITGSSTSPIQPSRNPQNQPGQNIPIPIVSTNTASVYPPITIQKSPTIPNPIKKSASGPKQFNIQPRPQVWFDPKDINQAPQHTQDRIRNFKLRIQSQDWHESTMPRLFIVLPKRCLYDDKITPGWDKFRFYWMCEYVDPLVSPPLNHQSRSSLSPDVSTSLKAAENGHGDLAPHIGHHDGYDLAKPEVFFSTYRAVLLLNMQMFKFSAKSYDNLNGREKTESTYSQSIAFLQTSLSLKEEEIELYIDLMISYLEQLSSEVTDKIQVYDSEIETESVGPLPILNEKELAKIKSFLVPTTLVDAGIDRLHNQYRFVDSEGHVQWICFTHMRQFYPKFNPTDLSNAIVGKGVYNPQEASVDMFDMSDSKITEVFSQTNLIRENGLAEIIFDMSKATWWSSSEWGRASFWNGLSHTQITSLTLTGSLLSFRTNLRPNSIFKLLDSNKRIQCLRIMHAQDQLMQIKFNQKFERLRVLEFSIESTKDDQENIKNALLNLINSSPKLKKLKIFWSKLDQGELVRFIRSISSRFFSPLDIHILTAEEELTVVTSIYNNFKEAHFKAATFAMAANSELVKLGVITSLTITERQRLDNQEVKASLTKILESNPSLHNLFIECRAIDFQMTEATIRNLVRGVLYGLSRVVLTDSLPDDHGDMVDFLRVVIQLTKPSSTRNPSDEDESVLSSVRAQPFTYVQSTFQNNGADNSLFYDTYASSVRDMQLGSYRERELTRFLYGLQDYKRVHLTCLAIGGFWLDLDKVLEKSRASLKLLAIRIRGSWGGRSREFANARIHELFRGDRLVMIHQDQESDKEIREMMAPSRILVTFASNEQAWDKIVSELFSAYKK
ncbi:hypothetical protein FBU30_003341 [Linnemannia zychae]|nr:hypothetical protein FBU30_003341 [Linnemannia zychae]